MFTVTANAQTSEKTKYNDAIEEKITQSIAGFSSVMDISNEALGQFRNIFGTKFTILAKETVNEADKQKAIKDAESKLRAMLNPYLINQLNEKGQFDKIVNLK